MKGCVTIEESLQSLIDAAKLYSKKNEGEGPHSFYPTMYHYTMIRYLKLVKRKAKFFFDPDDRRFGGPTLNWDVDE
jgi:hypothetical protein